MSDLDDDATVIANLLVQAGRRPQPPDETRQAVYVSTLVAWQQSQQLRRRTRQTWLYAAAAGICAMVVGTLWLAEGRRTGAQVVAWSSSGEAVRVGQALRVEEASERLYSTAQGEQLRVSAGTQLMFAAADRLQLQAGRLYVESGKDAARAGLLIDTPFGSVRHIGTRYAVEVSGQQLQVSVRDGRVALGARPGRIAVDGGQSVIVDSDGIEIRRESIPAYGAHWAWVEALAPPLKIDGRLLLDVLQDIALETGRRLEFANEDIRLACAQIRLSGPFLDMPAADRLFAVLVTTGLEATESGERIHVQRQTNTAPPRPVAN